MVINNYKVGQVEQNVQKYQTGNNSEKEEDASRTNLATNMA